VRVNGGRPVQNRGSAVVHPDGYVEIRERLKDVIISGGENISSVEGEGVLLRRRAVKEAEVNRAAERTLGGSVARVRRSRARGRRPALRRFGSAPANTWPITRPLIPSLFSTSFTKDGHWEDPEARGRAAIARQ
jgi:hypothetical protein